MFDASCILKSAVGSDTNCLAIQGIDYEKEKLPIGCVKITNLFETATRMRYRYPYHGMISTEDLWILSMNDLDYIYQQLSDEREKTQKNSLMVPVNTCNEELDNKIEIVKYIFQKKAKEQEDKNAEAARKQKKERIMEILAKKQDQELLGMSSDELEKMLEDL